MAMRPYLKQKEFWKDMTNHKLIVVSNYGQSHIAYRDIFSQCGVKDISYLETKGIDYDWRVRPVDHLTLHSQLIKNLYDLKPANGRIKQPYESLNHS